MKANAVPVLAIFESKSRLEVPLFQRQYVWSRDQQWEPLWEDISRKFSEYLEGRKDAPIHFLGAMVFDQKQTPTGHVEKRQVIDGQQRLTTLQIFLAALRDFCGEHGCDELASECEGFLANRGMKSSAEDKFKVWPTQLDRPQFVDVIESRSRVELERRHPLRRRPYARYFDPRPRMVEAYIYFYDALQEFFVDQGDGESPTLGLSAKLEECFGALRGALQVVVVDLDREDDAQVIFETLNARGEPLLPADLLRNFIFLRAARNGEDQERLYVDFWSRFDEEFWRKEVVQGRLSRPRSDLFLQHYLANRLVADIPVKHLYVEYKYWIERIRPFVSVSDELLSLARFGDVFRRIIDPTVGDAAFRIANLLRIFDISTVYPLLLELLTMDLAEADWIHVSRLIESYIVRREVCKYTTKSYNRTFMNATRLMKFNEEPVKSLQSFFSGLRGPTSEWPDDETFRNAWCNEGLYSEIPTPRVVYILRCLSDAMINLRSESITVNSSLTVEHIMPQSWLEHWPLPCGVAGLGRYDLQAFPDDDIVRQESARRWNLINTVGNLTAITQGLNSEVSNAPWESKKPRLLEASLLPINQRLHSVQSWNDETIIERSLELFDIARHIWEGPIRAQAPAVLDNAG